MFEVLVESAVRRQQAVGPRLLAVSAHVAVGIVTLWGRSPSAVLTVPREPPPIPIFTAPIDGRFPVTGRRGSVSMIRSAPIVPKLSTGLPEVAVAIPEIPGVETAGDPRTLLSRDGLRGPVDHSGPLEGPEMLAGEVDEPVVVVLADPPRYPPLLADARITGSVLLQYIVDTTGRCEPASIRVLRSTNTAFEGSAKMAVIGTIFRPARAMGRLVRQLVRQTVAFRLD